MVEYAYRDTKATHANSYLWPVLTHEIGRRANWREGRTAFDLGCGNGATSGMLAERGFSVTGVDTSQSGITLAQKAFPSIRCEVGSAYDDLSGRFGRFDLVVSLEVIEHCMDPKAFCRTFLSLIAPGGLGILSTPYHGYLKNLALAVTGKMDDHFTVLWDGGHIKFFSIATLKSLLNEAGAQTVRFERVGRIPALAKSMVAIVEG